MSENINVLGKGFEYEERIKIRRIQETLSGTIAALVGGANWGPINIPTLTQNFDAHFGTPLVKDDNADFSGLAAKYLLNYAPFCWYTRIADGSQTVAQYNIFKAAEAAKIIGTQNLQNAEFIIYSEDNPYEIGAIKNNLLKIEVETPTSGGPQEINLELTATDGCDPVVSENGFPSVKAEQNIRANWNLTLGETKNFLIDDRDFRYIVRDEFPTPGTRNPDEPDFLNLVVPTEGTFDSSYSQIAVAAWFEGTFNLPDTPAVKADFSNEVDVVDTVATSGYQTITNSEGVFDGTENIADGTYNLKVTLDGTLYEINTGALETATVAEALAELDAQLKAEVAEAEIAIDDDKIKVTSGSVGSTSTVLIEDGDTDGFITELDAIAGVTTQIDDAVDGDDTTYKTVMVSIEADVAGEASNVTITGDDETTINDLITALTENYTVSAGGTEVLRDGYTIDIDGGADAIENTSTEIAIKALEAGTDGNTTLTGDGTQTINQLLEAEVADYELKYGNGDQILKTGSTIEIAGGTAEGVGQWLSYTPAEEVNTYAKRFVYALKKYVVVPKLQADGFNLGDAQERADLMITTIEDGAKIQINSLKKGSNSSITIFRLPKVFDTTSDAIIERGTDTDIEVIVSQINNIIQAAEPNSAVISIDPEDYYLIFSSFSGGEDYGIRIKDVDNNLYSYLGFTPGDMVYGSEAVADAGTFKAHYTGSDGNSLTVDKASTLEGYTLTIFFQGYSVASFFNYSYNKNDANFIGTLLQQDHRTRDLIHLELPEDMDVMPSLPFGQIKLSGGKSGISNLSDTRYNQGLDEYKNIDLYAIDLIAVSGHTSQVVHNKLEEICDYRRDCFTIVDMPEDIAGTKDIGANIYRAITWHNGLGEGRTKKLESQFVSTYYPYISIPDGTGDSRSTWYAPSVRVIGAIANSDKRNNHQFAAPAGDRNAPLTRIHHLAQNLREDEKARLYADELDNNINPLVYTTSRGFFIDGQKNSKRGGGAISRLDVLRTSLYIKKRVYEITPNYFWRPLNKRTMDEFAEELRGIGMYLSSSTVNAIKDDFGVVVDDTINTEAIEAKRGLIGIIEWTPIRSVEKIKVISIIRDLQVDVTFG